MSMPPGAAAAGDQALEIGRRLFEPADVLAASPGDASLGSGLAGTALLHARLSAADPIFAAAAARHLKAAAACAHRRPGGIYTGPGALATALVIATPYLPDPEPHRETTARATAWLSKRAIDISARHQRASAPGAGAPWHVHDAITGLSGIGRILLAALHNGHAKAAPGLTAALATLTAMIGNPVSSERPGWWLPAAARPASGAAPSSGAADTGTAHGIAGALALLSLATSAGRTVPGQTGAIKEAARWLLRFRDPCSGTWPPYISGDDLDRNAPPANAPGRRDAWCYGTPGIATALILAGRALADRDLTCVGEDAMKTLGQRPADTWDVTGPTLCHGHAGVLQAACRTSSGAAAASSSRAITASFDPRLPFAVAHHTQDGHRENRPGFLTGAAGTALALADYAQLPAAPVATTWDAVLLLS